MDAFVETRVGVRQADTLSPSSVTVLPLTTNKPVRVDGRRLRSERTRQLIIEAFLLLLRENTHMPTAVQIADRAGYSVRSVFQRFPDLHSLHVAATDFALGQALASGTNDIQGDRKARMRGHVEIRAKTCEEWLPLWRALVANRGESPALTQRVRAAREATWKRMEVTYSPELSTLGDAERINLLIALEALTDYESWARMRELHGLSADHARSVWTAAIDRLLPATPF
jgi:AcrR family transcriptional regulator